MKIQLFFLLLFFAASESFSQESKSNQAVTNVYHYRSNISLSNFDGTRSTIRVNGNSATLFNSDGSISTIDFCGNSSTLIAVDGTISSIFHNGLSSAVTRSDGSQFFVNHMQSTSSFSTAYGKHTITHNFGFRKERRHKNKIDVLIHMNWLMQQEALEAAVESNEEEH